MHLNKLNKQGIPKKKRPAMLKQHDATELPQGQGTWSVDPCSHRRIPQRLPNRPLYTHRRHEKIRGISSRVFVCY